MYINIKDTQLYEIYRSYANGRHYLYDYKIKCYIALGNSIISFINVVALMCVQSQNHLSNRVLVNICHFSLSVVCIEGL